MQALCLVFSEPFWLYGQKESLMELHQLYMLKE